MKLKILLIPLLMLFIISPAFAYFYGNDFTNIYSTNDPLHCSANDWSACDTISYYKIWDFEIDTKDLNFLEKLKNVDKFNAYLFLDYDSRITQSPLNDSIKEFKVFCTIRSPDVDNNTQNIIINKTYNISTIDSDINSSWYYLTFNAGDQLYCKIDTVYYNHSVFYEVNAVRTRLYLPSYKSTYDYVKVIADKDEEINSLKRSLDSKYKNYADLSLNAFAMLIKINVELITVLYWILKIGILILSILSVFYLVFILYKYIKNSF